MRPTLLDRLFAPVTVLPGIGPRLGRLFERAAGPLVVDLLWHLPAGVVDRRAAPPIGALNPRDWPDAIVPLTGWREAIAAVHAPQSDADLLPATEVRERLAYDEILASQLAVALVRARRRRRPGRILAGTGKLQAPAEAGFGFALTGAQRQALAEIAGDMKASHRMMRLLQGDVGSGKTVVALIAMLIAVESGGQAALMAPTEVLARQHHQVLQRLVAPAGVEVGLLTGREKGRSRDSMLASLYSGLTPVVVGTHALVQPDVAFRDLALAIIDEQHRFGVEQRLALTGKGRDSDTLLMSATPIPRTLMMTAYGDLDVSRLTEKPPGRQPVDTRAVPLDRFEEVPGGIARALAGGAKVFWVCPMVEDSETADIAAAEERYRALAALLPDRVGLVQGRLKGAEKDRMMAAFANGPV